MAPFNNIISRRADDESSGSPEVRMGSLGVPIYALVGICAAIVTLIGLALWLTVRLMRKRARNKRKEKRDTLFLTVKGVLDESSLKTSEPVPRTKQPGFHRANITSSIVMPDKAIIRPDATRGEIISFYSEQGNLPKPFAPFTFALNASHSTLSPSTTTETHDKRLSTQSFSVSAARLPEASKHDSLRPSLRDSIRESFFRGSSHFRSGSALSSGSRLSVFSAASSQNSVSMTGAQQRRVRQVFTPILPDELMLSLGERVLLLRSFDDGWCIVARPKPYASNDDAELGAVPAWCFVKLMKGLRSERPVRSSSLGVTVQVENDTRPRDDIISWSNF